MTVKVKNIFFGLIFILYAFNIENGHAECFLFDGTYIGAATVDGHNGKKLSRPLFIVVANQHITGFFASEDQKTHGPSGSSFNLGGLTVSSVYDLSLTTNGNILLKSKDGIITGKAKPGSVEGGALSFTGFYNGTIVGEFLPGDFINIGPDGSVILKVATDKGVVHAFGKMDPSGEFVQVFPEKGKGPKVTLHIVDQEANISVYFKGDTLDDPSLEGALTRFSKPPCNNSTSSSGGTSSEDKTPDFVKLFQSAVNSLSLLSSASLPDTAKAEINILQNTIKQIKLSLIFPPSECNSRINPSVDELSKETINVKTVACGANLSSCTQTQLLTISRMQDDSVTIKENISVDENSNGISDICEQSSELSELETLVLVSTTFKSALKEIDVNSRIARREAIKIFGNQAETEGLFTKISKLHRKIQSALKEPPIICQQNLAGDIVAELSDDISIVRFNLCINRDSGSVKSECAGSTLITTLDKLETAGKTILDFRNIDSNENERSDVCE